MEEDENQEKSMPVDLYDFVYNNITTIYPKSEQIPGLDVYINMAYQEILNLTNRKVFPKALRYLLLDMTTELYQQYTANINELTGESSNQTIQSMSEAGRSVTFGLSANAKTQFKTLLDKQLARNETQINRYRLLYRVGDDN